MCVVKQHWYFAVFFPDEGKKEEHFIEKPKTSNTIHIFSTSLTCTTLRVIKRMYTIWSSLRRIYDFIYNCYTTQNHVIEAHWYHLMWCFPCWRTGIWYVLMFNYKKIFRSSILRDLYSKTDKFCWVTTDSTKTKDLRKSKAKFHEKYERFGEKQLSIAWRFSTFG